MMVSLVLVLITSVFLRGVWDFLMDVVKDESIENRILLQGYFFVCVYVKALFYRKDGSDQRKLDSGSRLPIYYEHQCRKEALGEISRVSDAESGSLRGRQ